MSVKTPERNKQDAGDDAHNLSQRHADELFNKQTEGYKSTADELKELEDYANQGQDDFSDIENYANNPENSSGRLEGINAAEKYANDPGNNIRNAKNQEETGGWKNRFNGDAQENKGLKAKFGGGLKKNGPLGILLALLGFGGILGGGGFFASIGGINFKELAVEKFDTMSSIIAPRSEQGMFLRLYSPPDPTSAGCAIKVKCRFKGLTERQMQRLTAQGAKLIDKDGKDVTKNKLGRYTGGQKLLIPDAKGGFEAFDATQYKEGIRDRGSNRLRTVVRGIFAPRFLSFNDKIAKDIRAKKRITSNAKWGKEGDQKEAQKELAKAGAGDSTKASAEKNTKYEKNPDGSDNLDKPLPPASGSGDLDLGGDAEDINAEVEKNKQKIANGQPLTPLPDDVASVAMMDEYSGKFSATKGLKSVIGFLNPADAITGLCTVYQMANILITAALIISVTVAMRTMGQFFSTIDRIKAGDGTPDDAEKIMTILQEPDEFGDSYGDSFTYNLIAYGTVTSIALGASARGNDTIRTLSTVMGTVNDTLGGRAFVSGACNILTNPFTQVGLALTSFIPGVGQLTGTIGKVAGKGGLAIAQQAIKQKIAGLVEAIAKNATKDGLKNAASSARKGLYDIAKSPTMAIFLGGYLVERYGIPYLAQTIGGTEFVGANGKKTADGLGLGLDSLNATTSHRRGMQTLSKQEALAFEQFKRESTATYVADMQAETHPFDFYNPYSIGNRTVASMLPLLSRLDITKPSKLLSLPSSILSSLSTKPLLSGTAYAADQNLQDELNYCQDEYLRSKNVATTAYCNDMTGFRNLKMLTGVDPDKVIDYMLKNGHINNDGDPAPGSKYADFISKCVEGSEDKYIGDLGDPEKQLDPTCWNDDDKSEERSMFRLYLIDDESVAAPMDDENKSSSQASSAAPEECKTMAADDLGQISCHAYQFDPYGYLWGGGHGSTAEEFMKKFKAGEFKAGEDHILDCSGLIRMAIFDAFGVDVGAFTTSTIASNNKFKEVSKAESKAGDIVWREGHVELVVSNDGQSWKTIGAHQVYPDITKDIGPTSYPHSAYKKVYRFVK